MSLTVRDEKIPYHLAAYLDYQPASQQEAEKFLRSPDVRAKLDAALARIAAKDRTPEGKHGIVTGRCRARCFRVSFLT